MDTQVKANSADQGIEIGIKSSDRTAVVQMLNHMLADQHVLYIKLRNYHWNVEGMYFQQLHALFEEQYNGIAVQIDDIAERVRSLGHYAPGSMQEFRDLSRLQESGNLNGDHRLMLQNILADHEMIIQVLRQDLEAAMNDYNDAGTSDFLTALMEAHEKMAWMVRAHLKG
ncbi:MAG: DNA starvation/stationary phase protection protein [Bacteroidota bacterium]